MISMIQNGIFIDLGFSVDPLDPPPQVYPPGGRSIGDPWPILYVPIRDPRLHTCLDHVCISSRHGQARRLQRGQGIMTHFGLFFLGAG